MKLYLIILLALPPGCAEALPLRRLMGQFDACTGWDPAQARQRDTDNGLSPRARTAV